MVGGNSRKRRVAAALLVAAPLGLGWAAYRACADPWPARASLRAQDEWPLAFTPDGRSFATSVPGRITVRDWATGAVRSSWPLAADRIGVTGAYSPDGRTFAVATRCNTQSVLVELIDVATNRVRATGTTRQPRVSGFGFTPDGASVLVGSEDASGLREVVSLDAATGAVEFACTPAPPAGTGRMATSLDGRFLIYAHARGGAISIEEVRPAATRLAPTPTGLTSVGVTEAVDCSRDGRTLAVGRLDGTIDLWDIPGRRRIRTLAAPRSGHALAIDFVPGDRTLTAIYGNAPEPPYLRLVNQSNRLLGLPVAAPPTELLILDCATGRALAGSPGAGWPQYSRDGRMLATSDRLRQVIHLRDVPSN